MIRSGAELLIQSLGEHGTEIIFGYPGSCVMQVLDNLYRNNEIRHVLVRHEQGAVHAASGYSRVSGKAGVVLVTSGPAGTNTLTGIADAYASGTPLVVITGQVASSVIGSDAFQEVDMISLSASITKWNVQIRRADQIQDAVARAFKVAHGGHPGPVLLDITKDAQTDRAEYVRSLCSQEIRSAVCCDRCPEGSLWSETGIRSELFKRLGERREEVIWVIDRVSNIFYDEASLGGQRVLQSSSIRVPGFGLPAAIGASFATDRTICLVAGGVEFQSTIEELGVVRQEGVKIKIIVLKNKRKGNTGVKNPDFVMIAGAYGINGERINGERINGEALAEGIERMWNAQGCYLLEIEGGE